MKPTTVDIDPTDDGLATPVVAHRARLEALAATGLVDAPPSGQLDRLTGLAQRVLGVAVVLVSLVDDSHQFFSGQTGLSEPWASTRSTPLSHSFCRLVVESDQSLVIPDSRADPRVCANPAIGELNVAAYLGVPLRSSDGHVLGALCLIDDQPRMWDRRDEELATEFAALAEAQVNASVTARQLRRSTRQHRLSFEDAPIGKALVGLDGAWLEANPAMCRLLGYRGAELRALTLQDLTHPDDLALDLGLVAQLLAGDIDRYGVEKRYCRRDGTTVWTELHVSLARDDEGNPDYFISQIVDLTAQRRRRMELEQVAAELESVNEMLTSAVTAARRSENRYEALVGHLPDAEVYVFDDDRRLTTANAEAAARRSEWTKGLLGMRPGELFSPPIAALLNDAIDRTLREGPVSQEVHSELSGRYLHADVVPVDQPDGPETLVLARDVSASKVRERQIAEAEARWRAAFEHAPVAILEIGADGIIAAANPAMGQLVGRPWQSIAGMLFADLLHPDDREADQARATATAAQGSKMWIAQRRVMHTDGSAVWVSAHGSVVRSGGADVRILHLVDMTSELARLAAVQEAADRFAALVEHSPDIIVIVDRDLGMRYASPAWDRMFGAPSRRYLNTPSMGRAHPEDREFFHQRMAEVAAAAGTSLTFEIRSVIADGTIRNLEITATNHLDNPSIEGIVCNCRDITDRVAEKRALTHETMHDQLTALANRKHIDQTFSNISANGGTGHNVDSVVFYIDLDGFKDINDKYGHTSGDQVLVVVAERLRRIARHDDLPGRLGGDEFVLIARNLPTVSAAVDMAARIIRAISEPIPLPQRTVTIGCSIGIATTITSPPDQLLHHADTALYQAKANGRGRWELSQL